MLIYEEILTEKQVKFQTIMHSKWMHGVLLSLILANIIILGLETYSGIMQKHGDIITLIDTTILTLLLISISIRIIVMKTYFFRYGWNILDFSVILLSEIGYYIEHPVLKALRVLMIFRIIEFSTVMRTLIQALFYAFKGMIFSICIIFIVFYAFAIAGFALYGDSYAEYFGNLGTALITLFQIMLFDDFGTIVRPLINKNPANWIFILGFLLCSAFSLTNFLIGVAVEAINKFSRIQDEKNQK